MRNVFGVANPPEPMQAGFQLCFEKPLNLHNTHVAQGMRDDKTGKYVDASVSRRSATPVQFHYAVKT